jgi:hypothetical protein
MLVLIPALGMGRLPDRCPRPTLELWQGFYGWGHLEIITIAAAALVIVNNVFGFTGITGFARYVVTPVLLVWCTYLVAKFLITDHDHVQPVGSHSHLPLCVAVAAVIGFAMWGNEPDIWRYGQLRFWWPLSTCLCAAVFFVMFSAGGWMMANLAGAA